MTTFPVISVVIATRNCAEFLDATLQSVLEQTITAIEVLIIDDASEDDTPAVVRSYLGDHRVRYFPFRRLGQSEAKNAGCQLARGSFIAFLDADDVWLPTKLEQQLADFLAEPAVGVNSTSRFFIDPKGYCLSCSLTSIPSGDPHHSLLSTGNWICFSSVMIRRSSIFNAGLFDPTISLAIDYDLWLRISKYCRFSALQEPLVLYRTGHANLSQYAGQRMRIVLSLIRRLRGVLVSPVLLRQARQRVLLAAASALLHSLPGRAAWFALRVLLGQPTHARAWKVLFRSLLTLFGLISRNRNPALLPSPPGVFP